MLISGSLAILLIGIPYVSNASIDKFLTTADTLDLIWYHAVVIGAVIFNTGSLLSLYLYAEALFAA
jgi:hypothetical protein